MKRALIVGIDAYKNAPLQGCVGDAKSMSDVLSCHQDGSPNFDCETLVAPDAEITRPVLKQKIEELFAFEADIALFYFSGHGAVNNLGGYLVTQDARRYDEGVSMAEVLTYATEARAIRQVVIILDCCYSGSFGQVPSFGAGAAVLREGISILASSRPAQVSMMMGGGSAFTYLIRLALDGGAADVCGNVTVAGVYSYADQALGAWDQRPLFKSHVSKLALLRKCDPEVELPIMRKLPDYFPDPAAELPLDPTYEPSSEQKIEEHAQVFAHLQKFRAARLLVPVGEEHLYYAAVNSKSCKLTPLGRFYWHLAKARRL
jgi:uncharacterized caspase-like protein